MEETIRAARQWCQQNPGWEPICDLGNTDHLYVQWSDLPKNVKLSWRNLFASCAEDAYAEATHPCKVPYGFIDKDLQFHEGIPFGKLGMMVFQTSKFPEWKHPRA